MCIRDRYGDYLDSTVFLNKFVLSKYPQIILYKQGRPFESNLQKVDSGYRGALKMTLLEELIHSTQTNLENENREAETNVNSINEEIAEWEWWHTYEHIQERVASPGFLGGRRYMNNIYKNQSCFTIYEVKNLAIFQSAPYLERLNNPTPWTKKNAKSYIYFTRGAW